MRIVQSVLLQPGFNITDGDVVNEVHDKDLCHERLCYLRSSQTVMMLLRKIHLIVFSCLIFKFPADYAGSPR
jgi:hypothetical protein